MTEDDTFLKLKQVPFETVRLAIVDLAYKGPHYPTDEWQTSVTKILSTSGWTEDEYNKEFMKRRT
jgi:hypothetical protein